MVIEQGYLALDERSEIRLRRAGEDLFLTVKQGQGESRSETEVGLDPEAFNDLWPESAGRRVRKRRSRLEIAGGLVAELDRYEGELEGLLTVEVEFADQTTAAEFKPPTWFGRELTGDAAWANRNLATEGRPDSHFTYRLREGEEPATGITRIIVARTAQAAAEVRSAAVSDDPAGHVHKARKSLKKARSALRLLRGVITDEERKEANARCRKAAQLLSGARDAEVKLATLEQLAGPGYEVIGASQWYSLLESEAEHLRTTLNPDGLAEVSEAIEAVRRGFLDRHLSNGAEGVAGNIGRGYRNGRSDLKKARSSDDSELFHDWRKRAKDLRYQLEIIEPRSAKPFGSIHKQAKHLSESLGDLHDLDVLNQDLSTRDFDGSTRRRLAELIAESRDRLAEDCLEQGRATYELKPTRFTNLAAESLSDSA